MCYEIASLGFFVVVPEHQDGSANAALKLDREKNKHWIFERKIDEETEDAYTVRNSQVLQKYSECLHIFKTVEELNNGKKEDVLLKDGIELSFKNSIDFSNPIITGHSFGSDTVLKCMSDDENPFKVGVAYDAWLFPIQKDETIKISENKSILFVNCQDFQGKTNLETMSKFENDNNVFTLKKTNHYCQSDIPTIFDSVRIPAFMLPVNIVDDPVNERSHKLSVDFFQHFTEKIIKGNVDPFNQFVEENMDYLIKGTSYINE